MFQAVLLLQTQSKLTLYGLQRELTSQVLLFHGVPSRGRHRIKWREMGRATRNDTTSLMGCARITPLSPNREDRNKIKGMKHRPLRRAARKEARPDFPTL